MRPGHDNAILTNEAEQTIAVSLGSDHVAEHEGGIRWIEDYCGIDRDGIGLARRKMTMPLAISWVSDIEYQIMVPTKGKVRSGYRKKTVKFSGFVFDASSSNVKSALYRLYGSPEHTMWTAWDSHSFAALSFDPQQIAQLREIYEAMQSEDAAIWLGGGHVFKNAGLCIGIASRLGPDILKLWEDSDTEALQLKKDAAATGIEAKLKAAGRQWFALQPFRAEDGGVKFWLNPVDFRLHQAGYYRVEELEQWIENRGPVMKEQTVGWRPSAERSGK